MILLLGLWTLIRTRRLLIGMRRRRLSGCSMSSRLHPSSMKVLDSPRKLGEATRRRDGGEKDGRERGENDAPEWSEWLHGMGTCADGSNPSELI
jgi:hypothetical protein